MPPNSLPLGGGALLCKPAELSSPAVWAGLGHSSEVASCMSAGGGALGQAPALEPRLLVTAAVGEAAHLACQLPLHACMQYMRVHLQRSKAVSNATHTWPLAA